MSAKFLIRLSEEDLKLIDQILEDGNTCWTGKNLRDRLAEFGFEIVPQDEIKEHAA